jgi:hypothetical protein
MFHPMRRLSRAAVIAGIGAAAAYLFDPQNGEERRRSLADGLAALRSSVDRAMPTSGGAAPEPAAERSTAAPEAGPLGPGLDERVGNQWRPDVPEPRASHVLEDKVRSEVLGRAELRDVDIVLNDVDGTIEVRGEVADEQVRSVLVGAIRAVDGVRDVHDLTHRPGQPAPNKAVAGAPTTTSG